MLLVLWIPRLGGLVSLCSGAVEEAKSEGVPWILDLVLDLPLQEQEENNTRDTERKGKPFAHEKKRKEKTRRQDVASSTVN